jgi:hypothetical protein
MSCCVERSLGTGDKLMSNLCPKCSKDDQVQKVTAIVASGTYTTTSQVPAQGEIAGHKFYGTVQQTGTGRTELSQVLSMPTEKDWGKWKEKRTHWTEMMNEYERLHPRPVGKERNYNLRVGCLALGFIGTLFAFLALLSESRSFQDYIYLGLCYSTPLIAAIGVAKAIYELSNPKEYKDWDKARVEYTKTQKANLARTINDLQKQSTSKFNSLYYCFRDDVVFLPGTSFCVDSSEMKNMYTWEKLGQLNEQIKMPRAKSSRVKK